MFTNGNNGREKSTEKLGRDSLDDHLGFPQF
jgi:hypothetical protein